MAYKNVLILAMTCVASICGLAWAGPAEDAAAAKKKGDDLLAKADFDGALKAYATAAKTDMNSPEYKTQYMVLRQVMTIRQDLPKEKNAEKWQSGALKLRSFYHSRKLYNEALPLDKQIHEKLNNGESASLLADTYLALDNAVEAEKLLSGLDAAKTSPDTLILLGISQARQKKMDAAKATAAKVKAPADAGPGFYYNLACLQARVEDKAGAAASLTRCFEQVPPSRLPSMKDFARQDKDLSVIAGSPEFAGALKVESKVAESKCSGGGNCGSCAKKGGCSSGGAAGGCSEHKEAPAEKK
jgi:tetratricopeptide (TPR) repeat protein